MSTGHLSRRTLIRGTAAAALAPVAGTFWWRGHRVIEPAHGIGVGMTPIGQRQVLTNGTWPSGASTRVLGDAKDPAVVRARAAEVAWLDRAALPAVGTRWRDLALAALLDLRVLTLRPGRLVAGYAPSWRYVWPRDAAFGAAALAGVGLIDDAAAILGFLQQVSEPATGLFQARYRPDDGRPPDQRGVQLDGSGWALWATGYVIDRAPHSRQQQLLADLDPLIGRSRRAIVDNLSPHTGLPIAGPDYWEVPERVVTLGTVAPQLAGLRAAARLAQRAGDPAAAADLSQRAVDLRAALDAHFAPSYPRYPGGSEGDAAVTFLTAPIGAENLPVAAALRAETFRRSRRPAGGVAPGTGWKNDGVSWTPETALFALAASGAGDQETADVLLAWLWDHRTSRDSIPEKVNHDGSPGGPAPLAWTCALVLLTLANMGDTDTRQGGN